MLYLCFPQKNDFHHQLKHIKNGRKLFLLMNAAMYAIDEHKFELKRARAIAYFKKVRSESCDETNKKVWDNTDSYLKSQTLTANKWAMCYRKGSLLAQIESTKMAESIHGLYKTPEKGIVISKRDCPLDTAYKMRRFFGKYSAARKETLILSLKPSTFFLKVGLPALDKFPFVLRESMRAEYDKAKNYFIHKDDSTKVGSQPLLEGRDVIDPSVSSTSCCRVYDGVAVDPCWYSIGFKLPCKHIFLGYLLALQKKESNWFKDDRYLKPELLQEGAGDYIQEFERIQQTGFALSYQINASSGKQTPGKSSVNNIDCADRLEEEVRQLMNLQYTLKCAPHAKNYDKVLSVINAISRNRKEIQKLCEDIMINHELEKRGNSEV